MGALERPRLVPDGLFRRWIGYYGRRCGGPGHLPSCDVTHERRARHCGEKHSDRTRHQDRQKGWQASIGDYKRGKYSTLGPLAVNGKIVVGTSGGEFGVRGFIKAFDANTGKLLWTTYTIPRLGEPGHDTWKTDAWKDGGRPVWITGDYDPQRHLEYWGVGNAAD